MFICLVRMKKTFAEPSCHVIVKQLDTFYIFIKFKKMKVRVASQQCIQAISFIWRKAGILIRAQRHSIPKLEKLFAHWQRLQKHKTRQTAGHKAKEDEFVKRLGDLFDIAHADALRIIKIPKDKAFLVAERQKGRPRSMLALDMVKYHLEQRTQSERFQQSQADIEAKTSQIVLNSSYIIV